MTARRQSSSTRQPRLSKSRFVAGLQCHKSLWWRFHERDAPELVPDPALKAVFDQGVEVGEVAHSHFPGGVLIDLPPYELTERTRATAKAIDEGANVIYEASFFADDVFVSIDILHRESKASGWTLTEVKSTTGVKDEHLPDAAVQLHVALRAGLSVKRVELMHLNRACAFPDLSNLFVRADITAGAQDALPSIGPEIRRQLRVLGRGEPPDVEPGEHCTAPYECPFLGRCWPVAPEHHVSTLYKAGAKTAARWIEAGYETIFDLPATERLSEIAERQRRAVTEGRVVIEPGLERELATLRAPVAHLDFETVAPAIPRWEGCHPYDQVPVQFSVHVEPGAPDEPLRHFEYLADGDGDPRPAIARALVDALPAAGSIVVYNASFERRCLEQLAEAVPEHGDALLGAASKLVDLLPIVRKNVYHPDFRGSFSLKAVAPALAPELSYAGMDVAQGQDAAHLLQRLLLRPEKMSPAARGKARVDLLAYCKQDTLATVNVLERLRALAG